MSYISIVSKKKNAFLEKRMRYLESGGSSERTDSLAPSSDSPTPSFLLFTLVSWGLNALNKHLTNIKDINEKNTSFSTLLARGVDEVEAGLLVSSSLK